MSLSIQDIDPKVLEEWDKYISANSPLKDIKLICYYKFYFRMGATLQNGITIEVNCGGNADDIYKFSPEDGWYDWRGVEIREIKHGEDIFEFY